MGIITGKTKLLAVIGDPIEHSLSPVMHNAAIQALGVDYVYVPLPVNPDSLAEAIAGLTAVGCVGFNVTIPHKQAIRDFCTSISPLAQKVGAVNTVYRGPQGWYGTNTDLAGFLSPLQQLDRDWQEIQPVILGCGGAARAVVVACSELGCLEVFVVGRNAAKLEKFARSWQEINLPMTVNTCHWSQLAQLLPQKELIVNTTPLGMYPQVEACPLTEELLSLVSPEAIAYDLIYTPNPTRFLSILQQRGIVTINGLEMLVQQGAIALETWLKQPVPVEVMRSSLQEILNHVN